MTFSLILRDPEHGRFGAAISSSSPAVSARCINLKDGIGGANSQNVTDPRLGRQILAHLEAGCDAATALNQTVRAADQSTINYRQLLVLDKNGDAAAFSGEKALGTYGAVIRHNAVAGGNMLADIQVLDALVETALNTSGELEQRLLAALQAAEEAGGEEGPVHSAGITVVGDAGWAITDLRIDWADTDPISELAELITLWLPQRDDYITRGHNPLAAPSYGVPGDE